MQKPPHLTKKWINLNQMDSASAKKVILTPRDMELFSLLFRYKVASFEQIKRYVFPACSKKALYRRTNKLLDGGFLKKIGRYEKCHLTSGYSLTERSLHAHLDRSGEKLERKEIASASIHHDMALVDIGELFKKTIGIAHYRTENELISYASLQDVSPYRAFSNLRCDGMAIIELNKKIFNIAIEYESAGKERSRWEEKVLSLYMEDEIDAVFYICAGKSVSRDLMEVDKKIATDLRKKMYFADLEQFHFDCSVVTFKNSLGKSLNLNFHKMAVDDLSTVSTRDSFQLPKIKNL